MPSYNSLANLLFNEINTYMVTPSGEFSTVLEQKISNYYKKKMNIDLLILVRVLYTRRQV